MEVEITERAKLRALMEVNILLESKNIPYDLDFGMAIVDAVYDTLELESTEEEENATASTDDGQ